MQKTLNYMTLIALFISFTAASVSFAQAQEAAPKRERTVLVSGGEQYVEVNFDDLANTSVLVGALDLSQQPVLDEYAQLFYCKIYQDFFENDSQWIDVSTAIRKRFQATKAIVPQKYFFKVDVTIGRYDVASKSFPFGYKSVFNKVGLLEFYSQRSVDKCGIAKPSYFPLNYSVQLHSPLTLDKIEMTSQAMLQKVSEVPLFEGVNKKLTAVFFIDIEGYKEHVTSGVISKILFSGNLDKIIFYTDNSLTNRIRSIDFKSTLPPGKKKPAPQVSPQEAP